MLSCRELVDHADALLARELGWRERLGIALHLLICVNCRRYVRQLRIMLSVLRRHALSRDGAEESQRMLRRLELPDPGSD